jgi:ELWxxDGT repeat protein
MQHRFRLALLPAIVAGVPSAQLVTDTLIADINPAPAVVGSWNGGFASDGSRAWFAAIDGDSGESYRIWSTDGTPAGTVQLEDLAIDVLESVLVPGGDLVFVANELGLGVALWRSDGTPAGTGEVLAPQAWSEPPYDLTVFAGAVWFLAGQAATGVELWRHDLASGATALALELAPGTASGAADLFACAGSLLVAAPGHSPLFATDGTPGSVTRVATFANAVDGSFSRRGQVGARVVFNVAGFGADAGWWASDGTPAGTVRVNATFNDFWAVEAQSRVYFTAGGVASTPLLWETDGTVAGTLPVDLPSTTGGQRVGLALEAIPGVAIGDELFYSGFVPGAGFELCRANGAAGGAALAADVHPSGSSDPNDFAVFAGQVFFRAEDGVEGREIWRFDPAAPPGTPAQLVIDTWPGPAAGIVGASPTLLPTANGVLFGQNFPAFGGEPAITDGLTSGLLLNIGDDGINAGSNPRELARLGSRVLFQAFEDTIGAELWSTDGTGATLVADIDPTLGGFPGVLGSSPHHLVPLGDRMYFFAGHPASGNELWSTDGVGGVGAGTHLVADLIPGPQGVEPLFSAPPVELDGALYFIGREPDADFALYRADGSGATHVITTDPSGFFTEIVRLVRVNDRLLFQGHGPEGLEIWTSDGTAAGTSVLFDMNPGPESSFLSRIAVGDTWACLMMNIGSATTLWRTDGTTAGTSQFFSAEFGDSPSAPNALAFLDDVLLMPIAETATGLEPWMSDGTAAGTQLLIDAVPGPASSNPAGFTAAADRMWFAVASPPGSLHHGDLWTTDGTTAGSHLVASLPSPVAGAGIGNLWAAGSDGRLVFSNVDPNGEEWWVSDGTLAGTVPVTDSAPGPKFASPTAGVLLGGRLIFAAEDGFHGRELHALDLAATGGWAATPLGAGCPGSAGVPTLTLAGGAPVVGGALTLALTSAQPAGLAAWAYDDAYAGPPAVGECLLQLPAPTVLGATAVDGAGASALALALPPAPALAGVAVDVQALSVELGGPFLGLGALSNAFELVLGP